MRKREHTIRTIAVAATLAATGCGSVLKHGDVSPHSVEEKAHTLTQQTLDAIRPVIGSAGTSAEPGTWEQCTTETPGQHRFEYSYVVDLAVPQERSEAVLAAAKAHFAKEGYVPGVPDPKIPRVTATEAHSSWWIGVGVSNDGNASMFISVDSDCVFTTHDPPRNGTGQSK